jgi:AcrR family transcriptional regulator
MTDVVRPPTSSLWEDVPPPAARRLLLLAAVDCFGRQGFHGTTTRDIARRAEMSPAAIYTHYASKHDVLFEIIKRANEAGLELLRSAAEIADPADAVRQLMADFAAFHAAERNVTRVANTELWALEPPHRKRIMALRQEAAAIVEGLLSRGLESGAFDLSDVNLTATILLSLGTDVARWYSPAGRYTPAELGQAFGEKALRLCGVMPAGRRRRR